MHSRKYLTDKSVLQLENEYDFNKHSLQTEKVLDFLNEQAKAGAILKIEYIDIANRNKEPIFIAASPEDYYAALDRFDCKNGIDLVSDNGDFTAYIYGQNYTAYNEEFMTCTKATYHFLDGDQLDHLNFIKDGLEFIYNIGSESLEQSFLSMIYNHNDFFVEPDRIIDHLLKNKIYEIDIEDLIGFISSFQKEYELFDKDLEYIIEDSDCFSYIKNAVDEYVKDIKVSANDIKNISNLDDEIAQDIIYIVKTSYQEYKKHPDFYKKSKTSLDERIESAQRKNSDPDLAIKSQSHLERA